MGFAAVRVFPSLRHSVHLRDLADMDFFMRAHRHTRLLNCNGHVFTLIHFNKYDSRSKELKKNAVQFRVTDKRLADLQIKFDELQFKYDKLVKPARTATGKHVVEIRHYKSGGSRRIEYREPGGSAFRAIDRGMLEQRLAELRDRDPDRLYIRIIFPETVD